MTGDDIPDIGIGTYDTTSEVCATSVETALNIGYRHFDTAEMYENECAVGEALNSASVGRDDVFVATKIHSRNLGYNDVLEHARASCDRLDVDELDLLYVLWPIRSYDPEETLPAFDELYDRGVIRHIGISNFTPRLLDEARTHLDAPIFAHEVECHPLLQQEELRESAQKHDHYLVAYPHWQKGQ